MQNENNLPTKAAGEVSLQHPLPLSFTGKPTITTHSLNHFLPLYILSRALLALQITDEMQEAIVGGAGSNCSKSSFHTITQRQLLPAPPQLFTAPHQFFVIS